MILNACLLAGLAAPQTAPPHPRAALPSQEDCYGQQSTIRWFDGSFEELLAEAKKTERLVFLDIWAAWCHYCKRLDKDTLRDPDVAVELADVLCYSVDKDAKKNAAVVHRFKAHGSLPTLIFLEPDGELRDVFSGFKVAHEFIAEVRRIKRNENTFTGLRETIEQNPEDVDARYELAQKLRKIGDHRGHGREIAAIRRLDPEGRSVASRRLLLQKLRKHAEAELRPEPIYAFLEKENEPGLLFDGWYAAWKLEEYLTRVARSDPERALHGKRAFAAARSLWPHVPRKHWARVGNNLAWSYWEGREHLTPADMTWALEVARAVAKEAPAQAHVIDTLACCLWAVGRRDEAIGAVRRCIELDPLNAVWKQRLSEFLSENSFAAR